MEQREILFEYGFQSINGIVKKTYHLHEIPTLVARCDVWDILPLAYVRQFSGLLDRNGVRIFEGDILKIQGEQVNMVVSWSTKFASFVIDKKGWAFSHWFGESCSPEICDVIGNIHQNADLL